MHQIQYQLRQSSVEQNENEVDESRTAQARNLDKSGVLALRVRELIDWHGEEKLRRSDYPVAINPDEGHCPHVRKEWALEVRKEAGAQRKAKDEERKTGD
jgi:hypothetical protein